VIDAWRQRVILAILGAKEIVIVIIVVVVIFNETVGAVSPHFLCVKRINKQAMER
jgi:hypothetical protein